MFKRLLLYVALTVLGLSNVAATEPADLSCENTDIIKKYACLIWQEAEGSVVPRVAPVEFYAALQALNVVQNTVTSGRYSYLKRMMAQEFVSHVKADVCLDAGYGICGNHIIVFSALMEELDIPVRMVQFFYISNGGRTSHVAAEVKIGEKWVFLDVSWGSVYFSDPDDRSSYLSFEDINRIGYENVYPLRNELSTWFFSRKDTSYDTFGHMTAENRDIVVDRVGDIIALLEWTDGNASWKGRQIYSYFGDGRENGTRDGIRIYWDQPKGDYRFHMTYGRGGCVSPSQICVNDQCGELGKTETAFDFTTPGERVVLSVRTDDDVCYVNPKELQITRLPDAIR
ncbi:transglutaminase domain-containing protein [Hoeflea sp. YIM 152468]|uniref:transglutaminase domain-containing protein n=1 Tax=Hoeflea sp. YIM 152468 TaxID=3031759 RepID=UPI0023DA330F|nr:transglutaminase domain-containing protein [Hoeflea sp. YIM 152468]MDF1609619.1 transglutaminase domain-containing protein [Hoeflea sp. YIM 152468]